MTQQGVPAITSPTDDARESVFLTSAVLGAVCGAIGASVVSARLFAGEYAETFAILGAGFGCWVFATVGAAAAALFHHQPAPATADAHGPFGDAAMT